MNDPLHRVKSDLAFMRAVAEDRGPIPALLGWHLIAIGGIFGIALLHVWAVFAGLAPWPEWARNLLWLPGLIAYVPVNLFINLKGRGIALGPTARVFGAAWAAMGMMGVPAVLVLVIGGMTAGEPFYMAWPALALVLYGGAWVMIAMIRRRRWHWLLALGCFAAAIGCAMLIRDEGQWLLMSATFFLLVGAPGLAIIRAARAAGQT